MTFNMNAAKLSSMSISELLANIPVFANKQPITYTFEEKLLKTIVRLKVFVAAPFTREGKDKATAVEKLLTELGFTVVSSWHKDPEIDGSLSLAPRGFLIEHAERNLGELEEADILLLLDPELSTAGGCWVEFGVALASKIKIIAVGRIPDNNPYVLFSMRAESLDEACKLLHTLVLEDQSEEE